MVDALAGVRQLEMAAMTQTPGKLMKNKDLASSDTPRETPGETAAGKPAEAGAPARAAN